MAATKVQPGQTVTVDYTTENGVSSRRTIDVASVYEHYGAPTSGDTATSGTKIEPSGVTGCGW
jgi:hypothetical protein